MVALAPSRDPMDYPVSDGGFGGAKPEYHDVADEPIVDLVHLARQAMGDQALERELLELFNHQSAKIISQLAAALGRDAKFCGDLAHTLRGSALAVGAGRVARTAQAYEALLIAPIARPGPADAALAALTDAVGEARAMIGRLLD